MDSIHLKVVLILLSLMFLGACSKATYRVFDKSIQYDAERRALSLKYMEEHYGMVQEEPTIEPKMIVLHWTAIPDLERSFDAMNPVHLPGSRTGIAAASALNVSSHYLVDRDGTIFRQLPDTILARHVIGLNHCAIGVENVGGGDAPLTNAQLKANEQLVRHLKRKYDIQYVIGHYEYTTFEGHELWKEIDEGYRTVKTDPGEKFMKKIRKRLEDLELKTPPSK
ncbi:N-acetylmuramoyl-L-alanine amidase [Echinicola sp. CAU 1574]|uniref:N-acetylmuramoyl-L-alanine amidase n=1 Tax=Echinicola arenosa TaxID=2774144 RepID=A0ABR9AGL6_9BACT|nr:peptidoglycan recognition family protein [Echinicola arenosa]MBD8487916.1 N-acetylmuramoyl-L-alanine amidase [Echinicola arenosa]